VRVAFLVFGLLCCLYALTGGGQGYSVDGAFSYEVARSLATDPRHDFLARNRATLARWGPVGPVLGVPFTWLGARLGDWAPRPDTVLLDGQAVRLSAWPAIGAAGGEVADTLRLPLGEPRQGPSAVPGGQGMSPGSPAARGQLGRLRLVSFLSLSTALATDTPVAQVVLLGGQGGDVPLGQTTLRAGRETAEWAYDVPLAERPRHARALVAGHWPGNPQANLYAATLEVPAAGEEAAAGAGPGPLAQGPVRAVLFRYVAPSGRLHVRSVELRPPAGGAGEGWVALAGPATWTDADQVALFTRLGFSFLNAPLMALTAALLVVVAGLLGYGRGPAVLVALGCGVGTLAWPYAKHDFAEPAAGALALGATALVFGAAAGWGAGRRWGTEQLLVGAGLLAALAAGAKYTAAWFVPLLFWQVLLLWRGRPGLRAGAVFLAVPLLALAEALRFSGGAPAIWAGWRQGLASGWLDYSLWEGLYGLLLSPGKSLFLYAPPLLLAAAGLPFFLRRHRGAALIFLAAPLVYLVVYGSKGGWHGGGWGPRYLVLALPFMAVWSLPLLEWLLLPAQGAARRWLRAGAVGLLAAGVAVQVLGVAKHPNRYTVMFRDHILPQLPDYGVALGGPRAVAYWRHFGGPEAGRQLVRPPVGPAGVGDATRPAPAVEGDPPRGLGYLYAEPAGAGSPLTMRVDVGREAAFTATLYACDWDHRGRRQRLQVTDAGGTREATLEADFSGCEYVSWPVKARPDLPLEVRVTSLGGDVPVLSGLFFDPQDAGGGAGPRRDATTKGAWPGRYGADGYVLFAWRRGGVDVGRLPAYVAGYTGGERVWIDTGEEELGETALLYAPAFSPLPAHAWLLANDLLAGLLPGHGGLQQRALASPPWRYLAGWQVLPPHPEYGLGLDFWQVLLWSELASHGGFMAAVWATSGALLLGCGLCALALGRAIRGTPPVGRPAPAARAVPITPRRMEQGA
jgi:hypothetical protein